MGAVRAFIFSMVLLALAAGAGVRAWADAAHAGRLVVAATGLSMDQAVKMAEQRFKARVVRAETRRDGERTIYILKLLNEAGQVWTVRVDAANGAIL